MKKISICLLPEVTSLGGPRSFQQNFIREGKKSGIAEFHFDPTRKDIDAFLVIGGPRRFFLTLLKARQKGIPVVQRLNGMNWVHRVNPSGARYSLHSEMANVVIALFRRFICSKIIYQSQFCLNRWNSTFGTLKKPQTIINNGIDISLYHPKADGEKQENERPIILVVEGNLSRGLERGLYSAINLLPILSKKYGIIADLQIAGCVSEKTVLAIRESLKQGEFVDHVEFLGVLEREQLIEYEQNADLLFSAEIATACPNAVIEAMACGLPVIGFDTGALKEIVGEGGEIADYGSGMNYWKLDEPDIDALAVSASRVLSDPAPYRKHARDRAVSRFNITDIVSRYVDFCTKSSSD